MNTVFLSGSRCLSRLNENIRQRLNRMIENGLHIVVGDANGADKAMQAYLSDAGYKNVTVYCAGSRCRNNIGNWSVVNVSVDSKLKGRAFYTQKDKEMARMADIGFVVWDGKSIGSMTNAFELLGAKKKVVVYFSPQGQFLNFSKTFQLTDTITNFYPETAAALMAKLQTGEPAASQAIQETLPIF